MSEEEDVYSRVDYRRFVGWTDRIRREGEVLQKLLEEAPLRRVVDLGCGTGEHVRFFASLGAEALGVDRSESMLEKAREQEVPEKVGFLESDLRAVDQHIAEASVGLVISLGNTLVHLTEEEDLRQAFSAVARIVAPEGYFYFQILNYDRIFEQQIRNLPLNFKSAEEGETVFLRLMDLGEDRRVRFCPTTLLFQPDKETPVEVVRSRSVDLVGWGRDTLVQTLEETGFHEIRAYGDMEFGPYVAEESSDLVLLARRES